MIQEIAPKKLHIEYRTDRRPCMDSGLIICDSRGVLVMVRELAYDLPGPEDGETDESRLLSFRDAVDAGLSFMGLAGRARYLFRVDDQDWFLCPSSFVTERMLSQGFRFFETSRFRFFASQTEAFIAVSASQIWRFYDQRKYCGRCGTKTVHSGTERAMVCPACRLTEYPKISPAVIVAVRNKNRILLTRYMRNAGSYRRKALIAGFVEVGETPEDTVRREVFEECGIHVKNIRPYKAQPWAFSDSLMLGYTAELDGPEDITLQRDELCEAAWYERKDVPENPNMFSVGNEMIQYFKRGILFPGEETAGAAESAAGPGTDAEDGTAKGGITNAYRSGKDKK